MEGLVDLHTHTKASDGTLSPEELVQLAGQIGLRAVAITDHDTTDGLRELEGTELPVELVPGLEVSCSSEHRMLHILGYYIDPDHPELKERLEFYRNGRGRRNRTIIEKLNELGIDIRYEEVIDETGGGVPGRPHIARVLLKKGVVATIEEAFQRYLGRGGSVYTSRDRFKPEETIAFLRRAGGVPVLAHPSQLGLSGDELFQYVKELKDNGLEGIEVWYSTHSEEQVEEYSRVADSLGLIKTGGSDFHGEVKPDIQLGSGKGTLSVPYAAVEDLKRVRSRLCH